MSRDFWAKIKAEIPIWRRGAIPGLTILGLIIIARLTGLLQSLEWSTLDTFLRLRPSEPIDERITIIGIDDEDITDVVIQYPIPDREIANLIKTLQKYQPIVIGLDNIRDIPVDVGHDELVEVFKNSKNLIGIEKVLPPPIKPPQALPPQQIGFSDAIPDPDGQYRRSLLGTPTEKDYKFSLSIRLAETYLATTKGFTLESGIRDRDAMRFGSTELPRFFPNTGGYSNTPLTPINFLSIQFFVPCFLFPFSTRTYKSCFDAEGVQVLLNYRNNRNAFRILNLRDIKTGKFDPNWIKNRIIIIGTTALSAPDLVNTSAIKNLKIHGQIYGVEFQAHSTSQIISAVLNKRPLLRTWSEGWEYLWIIAWGILAISFGRFTQSALKNLLIVGVASLFLMGLGYILILLGWWLPTAPTLLILVINGIGAIAFYEYDRSLRLQIEERQRAIQEAYDTIHEGPIQEIFVLSRAIQRNDFIVEELPAKLQKINQGIRETFDHLLEKTLTQEKSLRLGSGLKIDLASPIHNLFYEVYRETIQRDLPYFQTLKFPIVEFAPIEPDISSFEQKRLLCQFLEEAICNVGKHAHGVTRIEVIGKQQEGWYILSIKDNGVGLTSSQENQGTKSAKELAKILRGKFKRESLTPSGTLCELTWKLSKKKLFSLTNPYSTLNH